MQLAMWTYEGPPHVGAMRIATAMDGLHYVLHAPQGDTYADLLFTMIERQGKRPPVTYTTFQARDLGSDTAHLFQKAAKDAYKRFKPQAVLVGASCTAELLQDDPGGLAASSDLPVPVVPVELPAYQKRENWGASETLLKLARTFAGPNSDGTSDGKSCNLLGPTALGFRHRDDVVELTNLLAALDIEINVTAPLNATPADLARLPQADFNVVMYPEVASATAQWMQRQFGMPFTTVVPIGVGATREFIGEVARLADVDADHLLSSDLSQLPWYSRSVDSNYLTGKRVFVFADATHAIAAARICTEELGFKLVGLGSYSREFSREVREEAERHGLEALITDDHMEVEEAIEALRPELVLGTQMERHIAKRFGIGCAVISSPVHVQDFPARYSPQMGFEGANVIFDTWVHPLTMGLEEHLLTMFREDFEFGSDQVPSHLASEGETRGEEPPASVSANDVIALSWQSDAEQELKKVPFFVRGKARRNTEKFATEQGLSTITLETLYDAKAHFSR